MGAARTDAPTTDTLAPRATIAVVVPATNTVVQPEYDAMRPAGVTNHVTRMFLPPRPYDDMNGYKKALHTEEGKLREALDLVLPCEPHVVAHGHSIHSFRGDIERAKEETRRLEDYCGRPFITPSIGVIKGLEAMGRPRRLGVLTPYWPPAGEMVVAFLRSAGYEPVRVVNMQAAGPTEVAKTPLDRIFKAFEELDVPQIEAYVQVGTALPVAGVTGQIEKKHGKPLVGVNAATYWAALRAAGIEDKISGFGVLLASH